MAQYRIRYEILKDGQSIVDYPTYEFLNARSPIEAGHRFYEKICKVIDSERRTCNVLETIKLLEKTKYLIYRDTIPKQQ